MKTNYADIFILFVFLYVLFSDDEHARRFRGEVFQ